MTEPETQSSSAHDGAPQRAWPPTTAQLLLLALTAVLLRLPFISVPMINDEGGYAYWASIWTHAHQPYRDFEFGRPQAILLVYKAAMATVGGTVEAFRLCAALVNAVTTVILFGFARRLFSERTAFVSALAFTLFSTSPRIEGFTANAEIFTLAPLVLNAWLVWERRWLLAGVATAVAFQLKPSGIEGCVLIALWLVYSRRSWKDAFKSAAQAASGFLLALLPALMHGLWVGWDAFWFNQYTLRTLVYAPEVTALSAQFSRLAHALIETLSAFIVPGLLFVLALFGMPRPTRAFCLCWLVAACAGMQAGLWWDWHFFVQIVPPLCVASGAGLLALRTSRQRGPWALSLLFALGLFALRDGRLWLLPPRAVSWAIYHRSGYLHDDEISAYVKHTTTPKDSLYVAFSQAELYYLSSRAPAVPSQLFTAQATYLDRSWKDAMAAIRARKPSVIVWAQPPPKGRMSPSDFGQLLEDGYALDRTFGSIPVFRRRR
jgi:hypothetical protein